jgi:hypothetical protein
VTGRAAVGVAVAVVLLCVAAQIAREYVATAVDCALATPLDTTDFDTHVDQALAVVAPFPSPTPAAPRDELATRRSQRGTR